jgi:hypothetical protein
MQSNAIEFEAMTQEDKHWLESDLSHFSEYEPYDWGDVDPQTTGKPIQYEAGLGLIIEDDKDIE